MFLFDFKTINPIIIKLKAEETILGIDDGDTKDNKIVILETLPRGVPRKSSSARGSKKPSNKSKRIASDAPDDIKLEDAILSTLPSPKRRRTIKSKQSSWNPPPMVTIAHPSSSIKTGKDQLTAEDMREFSIPLLTLKTPNKRERKREIEVQKNRYFWMCRIACVKLTTNYFTIYRKRLLSKPVQMVPLLKQPKIEIDHPTHPCSICHLKFATKAEMK